MLQRFTMYLAPLSVCTVVGLIVTVVVKEGLCAEADLKPELYLLVLAPYPDPDAPDIFKPQWDSGPALIPAARLAVELINNRTDVLADYTLALIEGDSGCNEFSQKGPLAYVRGIFHGGKLVLGVVGPQCSSVAVQIGTLVPPERTAMIHVTDATSPQLTDRVKYPYTFLAISSSKQLVTAFVELMRVNQWNRFGVLYDGGSVYHLHTLTALSAELKLRSMTGTLEYYSALYDFFFPLQEMRDSQLRVFFILAGPLLARQFLCLALRHENHQFLFPTYQWIFIELTLGELTESTLFSYNQKLYSCSAQELTTAVEGSIILQYKLTTSRTEAPTVSGLNYSEYEELYRRKVEEHEIELNSSVSDELPYFNAYHDSVWAIALALNASIQPLSQIGVSLLDYQPTRNDITDVIRQQLIEVVKFNGVSGNVEFDNSTGQTVRAADIFQVQENKVCQIGTFYPSKTSDFSTNGSFVHDSFSTKNAQIHAAVFVSFLVASLFQLVAVVAVHVVNIYYRNNKTIKASSPRLNHLMFAGSYLLVIVLLELLILGYAPPPDRTVGVILCNSVLCCVHLGMSLILTTICIKIWRIYRIFVHSWKPGNYLHNRVLVIAIVLLVCPVIVYCVIRCTADPLKLTSTEKFRYDESLPYIEVTDTCEYKWYDTVVLQLYEAILLASALYLSIRTRHVNQKFKTTRSTTALIYSLVLISSVGISLYLIALLLSWDLNITYSIQCVTYNCVLFVCLVFGFVPPVIPLVRDKLKLVHK